MSSGGVAMFNGLSALSPPAVTPHTSAQMYQWSPGQDSNLELQQIAPPARCLLPLPVHVGGPVLGREPEYQSSKPAGHLTTLRERV